MTYQPETPVIYVPTGQLALTRHSFHSCAEPAQDLVEVYRHGDRGHYIGFVDSSQVLPI